MRIFRDFGISASCVHVSQWSCKNNGTFNSDCFLIRINEVLFRNKLNILNSLGSLPCFCWKIFCHFWSHFSRSMHQKTTSTWKKCKLLLGKKNFVDIKPQQTSLIDSYVVRRRIKSFMKKTIVKMMRILVQNIDITLQVNNEQDAKIFMVFFMCKFCIAKVKCKYLMKFTRMHFVRKLSTKTQCRLNNCVEISWFLSLQSNTSCWNSFAIFFSGFFLSVSLSLSMSLLLSWFSS